MAGSESSPDQEEDILHPFDAEQRERDLSPEEEAEMDVLPDELRSRTLCDQTSEMCLLQRYLLENNPFHDINRGSVLMLLGVRWLWHGTKPSLIDTLIKFGLDARTQAIYFAQIDPTTA